MGVGLISDGPEPIEIRYDGLDASKHVIDIEQLSASLRGMGRIIGVVATFAVTQKVVPHKDARPIRVVIGPPKANCVTFQAFLLWVDQHQTISGIASGLTVTLIAYVFSRASGNREEMKHLKDLAGEAIRQLGNRDEAVISRLLDTVDKMADSLKPSARQAVKPVGSSAGTMTIGTAEQKSIVIDKPARDAIDAATPPDIGDEVIINVRFVEMNLDNRTCRLALEHSGEERFSGEITDPEILLPNNRYASAFAAQDLIEVRAKPTLREGRVERWYISSVF